jgi:hypothetical protein
VTSGPYPSARLRPARTVHTVAALLACRRDDAMDPDIRTRAAIEEHWRASESGDSEAEHAIYAADAILDYPQSGERFRGRATISAQRGGHPASRHFTVVRILGSGKLWVSECVITYDGAPTYSVSIREIAHEQVVHETQYFADTSGRPHGAQRSRSRCRAGTSPGPDHGQERPNCGHCAGAVRCAGGPGRSGSGSRPGAVFTAGAQPEPPNGQPPSSSSRRVR